MMISESHGLSLVGSRRRSRMSLASHVRMLCSVHACSLHAASTRNRSMDSRRDLRLKDTQAARFRRSQALPFEACIATLSLAAVATWDSEFVVHSQLFHFLTIHGETNFPLTVHGKREIFPGRCVHFWLADTLTCTWITSAHFFHLLILSMKHTDCKMTAKPGFKNRGPIGQNLSHSLQRLCHISNNFDYLCSESTAILPRGFPYRCRSLPSSYPFSRP